MTVLTENSRSLHRANSERAQMLASCLLCVLAYRLGLCVLFLCVLFVCVLFLCVVFVCCFLCVVPLLFSCFVFAFFVSFPLVLVRPSLSFRRFPCSSFVSSCLRCVSSLCVVVVCVRVCVCSCLVVLKLANCSAPTDSSTRHIQLSSHAGWQPWPRLPPVPSL